MKAFLNQREIVTLHDGRYKDIIRGVYMELMSKIVGVKNVPKIIKTDGEDYCMTQQRLRGSTFAKYMLLKNGERKPYHMSLRTRTPLLQSKERERYITINYFFCGLHILVCLSELANKTLSLCEGLVHSGEKVGAPTLPGGYSIPGESGTPRLVRTVCEAVQDRG
ncbi:Hypothetical predicted protein [Mytilus galloprovincialis]|uniref:Uncharacterized protein n=1 Tax=Mytilus galloprovincialis TaxID=29158 RepID=A0A8B6BH09_MYTGA|nr:Hypothetical predicted protein [Mytilus galloprovincialis]